MTEAALDGATRWWWLRHAPVPDPEGRITGSLDLPCDTSDDDWFAKLALRLPKAAVLVESGLIRCAQTRGALEAAGLRLGEPLIEPDLAEQNFGRWQGQSWAMLASIKEPGIDAFWADPAGSVPPGGESFAELVRRTASVISRLSESFAGRDILAIAHAGTIRAALAVALDLEPASALSFAVAPLSLTRIDRFGRDSRIVGVNWQPD